MKKRRPKKTPGTTTQGSDRKEKQECDYYTSKCETCPVHDDLRSDQAHYRQLIAKLEKRRQVSIELPEITNFLLN